MKGPGSIDLLGADEEALLAEARAAWPGVELDAARFIAHVRSKWAELSGKEEAALVTEVEGRRLRVADLYLACACAEGVPAALAAFDNQVMTRVRAALYRHGQSESELEETLQVLRISLFVKLPDGDERPPRIVEYAGHGSLRGWTTTVALRLAMNLKRYPRPDQPGGGGDGRLERLAADSDVDLELLRLKHGATFKRAIEAALEGLSLKDRNLLRLVVLEGATLEHVGRLRGVHKSTVSRQFARARRHLRLAVRETLTRELGLSTGDVDSLVRLLRSGASVSMRALLYSPPVKDSSGR